MQSRAPPLFALLPAPLAAHAPPHAAPNARDHFLTPAENAAGKDVRKAPPASVRGRSWSERITASSTGETLKERANTGIRKSMGLRMN